MIAADARREDVAFVLEHMREHNRRELTACRWEATPALLAAELEALAPVCIKHFALGNGAGEPVALVGAWIAAPGVAHVRFTATDQWLTIARPAYRWIKRRFIPFVLMPNVRRAETRVLDTGWASREWLRRIGFHDEGTARALGRNGEDFVHVAWINPTWRQRHV